MTLSAVAGPTAPTTRIEFARGSRTGFAAFLRCSVIHEGNYDQARSLGLYVASWQQREQDGPYVLYYAPQVGIYTAPDRVNQTAGLPAPASALPARTPASPFALAGACPASIAPATAEIVARLKAYIDGFPNAARGRRCPTVLRYRSTSRARRHGSKSARKTPACQMRSPFASRSLRRLPRASRNAASAARFRRASTMHRRRLYTKTP